MYICKKRNSYIHWWGETLVFISPTAYYKLSNLETFMVQKILQNNDITAIISIISDELKVNIDESEKFVLKFMDNYGDIFEAKKTKNDDIYISGEKGKFFPIELHISLTSVCNQKCIHCYKNAGTMNENIDYSKLVAFLKYMEGKVPFLTLSGGDALMYPYIENILEQFGEIYPCGICKNEKLLMGDINDYMSCVNNIVSYYDRISKIPMIRKMDSDDSNCPFEEEV